MNRKAVFILNVALGMAASTAFALACSRAAMDLGAAFLTAWWAGFGVGVTVAAGATLGPRPPLGILKCAFAQGVIVATSALGAYLGSLFPQEVATAEEALRTLLAQRGIALGAGIGAAIGTALEIVHVYRMRRSDDRVSGARAR